MELKVLNKNKKTNLFILFSKDNSPSREELIWNANGGLTEKQIEQYLIVARYLFNSSKYFIL